MSSYAICIIGNSHSAALYHAWKNRRPVLAPGTSLTFFAAQFRYLQYLTLAGTRLIPDDPELAQRMAYTSGGSYFIDLDRYDSFILVGLHLRADVAVLSEEYGSTDHLKWGRVATLVSKACFDRILTASLTENFAFQLLDMIRSVSRVPVLISPVPFQVEQSRPTDNLRSKSRRATIMRQAMEAGVSFARDRGGEILWQDETTIASPGVTKSKYSRNGLQLQDKLPRDDGAHMNEKFGYIALTALLARLDAISGGLVLPKASDRPADPRHLEAEPDKVPA